MNLPSPSELIQKAQHARMLGKMHEARQTESFGVEEPVLPAQPAPTNHANYSRLMRSHDRIRTRHLSKNSG